MGLELLLGSNPLVTHVSTRKKPFYGQAKTVLLFNVALDGDHGPNIAQNCTPVTSRKMLTKAHSVSVILSRNTVLEKIQIEISRFSNTNVFTMVGLIETPTKTSG